MSKHRNQWGPEWPLSPAPCCWDALTCLTQDSSESLCRSCADPQKQRLNKSSPVSQRALQYRGALLERPLLSTFDLVLLTCLSLFFGAFLYFIKFFFIYLWWHSMWTSPARGLNQCFTQGKKGVWATGPTAREVLVPCCLNYHSSGLLFAKE